MSGLIKIILPILMYLFLAVCVQFAQMDLLDGQNHFERMFNFKETFARSEQFNFFEMQDSNFIGNSGSYFIIIAGLILYYVVCFSINKICKKLSRFKMARRLGIITYSDDYVRDF